jgi:hypothetical protein
VKDAKAEAQKEIEEYRRQKEEEFRRFEAEVFRRRRRRRRGFLYSTMGLCMLMPYLALEREQESRRRSQPGGRDELGRYPEHGQQNGR